MLQKRLITDKNKCCGCESVLAPDLKNLGLGGQRCDREIDSIDNHQGEERIFVLAGCSWYLEEVKRMHVSGQSVWTGRVQQHRLFYKTEWGEHLLFDP